MKLERAEELAKEKGYALIWDERFKIYRLENVKTKEYVGIRAAKIASLDENEFITTWLTF